MVKFKGSNGKLCKMRTSHFRIGTLFVFVLCAKSLVARGTHLKIMRVRDLFIYIRIRKEASATIVCIPFYIPESSSSRWPWSRTEIWEWKPLLSILASSFKQKRRLNSPTYHQQLPQFFSTPSQESQSCRRRFRVRATFRITSVRHNHEVSACSVDTYIHICCMLFERRGKKCPISDFCQKKGQAIPIVYSIGRACLEFRFFVCSCVHILV